jgi:hypothetical protein
MNLHAKRLSTYLNDHLAAATGGVELAKRALSSNQGTPYEGLLRDVAATLEADKDRLLEAMDELEVGKNAIKESLGWIAEKVGRLKPNDQLTGYSPLSRVVELEALTLILGANRALWATLTDVAGLELSARVRTLDALAERLEPARLEATREALTS